ncbi:hypothetical protein BV898_18526 [Hypsibius exemplaris]|uniref:G-protein coupled receptors family 1 profile domain-containing protein n=1 Tax=Hypsibius exemplaris TaxID=2072580 RepID=A0A9X6RN43_HYPEX|nr:hypothetical protein BV898_18526 [Hypsibius exemplaris]
MVNPPVPAVDDRIASQVKELQRFLRRVVVGTRKKYDSSIISNGDEQMWTLFGIDCLFEARITNWFRFFRTGKLNCDGMNEFRVGTCSNQYLDARKALSVTMLPMISPPWRASASALLPYATIVYSLVPGAMAPILVRKSACWTVAWTPYTVVALMGFAAWTSQLTPLVAQLPAIFAKTAACYNPVVYVLAHQRYRQVLSKQLAIVCRGKRPLQHLQSTSSSAPNSSVKMRNG